MRPAVLRYGRWRLFVPLAMPATLRLLDAIRLEVILSRMITQLNTGLSNPYLTSFSSPSLLRAKHHYE
jgi:hypothetical protein